jgi:hypothetical protein
MGPIHLRNLTPAGLDGEGQLRLPGARWLKFEILKADDNFSRSREDLIEVRSELESPHVTRKA